MASPSNLALVLSSIDRNQNHLDGTDQPVPTKRKGSIRLTEVKRMARARGSSQLQLAVSDVQRASGESNPPLADGLQLQQANLGLQRMSLEPDHSKVININVAIPPDMFQSPHTVINLNVCPVYGEAGVVPSTEVSACQGKYTIGRLTNSDSPTPSSSKGAPSTTDAVWGHTFDPVPRPLKPQTRAKQRKGKEKVNAGYRLGG